MFYEPRSKFSWFNLLKSCGGGGGGPLRSGNSHLALFRFKQSHTFAPGEGARWQNRGARTQHSCGRAKPLNQPIIVEVSRSPVPCAFTIMSLCIFSDAWGFYCHCVSFSRGPWRLPNMHLQPLHAKINEKKQNKTKHVYFLNWDTPAKSCNTTL